MMKYFMAIKKHTRENNIIEEYLVTWRISYDSVKDQAVTHVQNNKIINQDISCFSVSAEIISGSTFAYIHKMSTNNMGYFHYLRPQLMLLK